MISDVQRMFEKQYHAFHHRKRTQSLLLQGHQRI